MKDKWNQLDVMIVILSICGIILEEMESELIPINPTIIRVMRVARIARVLKLLKMAKGMRALLNTVMQALPQVGNLGLLFFLLFFIFAALGVELFGRLGKETGTWPKAMFSLSLRPNRESFQGLCQKQRSRMHGCRGEQRKL